MVRVVTTVFGSLPPLRLRGPMTASRHPAPTAVSTLSSLVDARLCPAPQPHRPHTRRVPLVQPDSPHERRNNNNANTIRIGRSPRRHRSETAGPLGPPRPVSLTGAARRGAALGLGLGAALRRGKRWCRAGIVALVLALISLAPAPLTPTRALPSRANMGHVTRVA